MGSPQPPNVMPQLSLDYLPFDVQYSILESLDSFSTLSALTTATSAYNNVAVRFPTGITQKIADTEFAPLEDALLAVRVLDADEGARQAVVAEHYDPEMTAHNTTTLDEATKEKLHILNSAANELASEYCRRRTISTGLKGRETLRFKRAMWRSVVLFELYKEQKALSAESDTDTESPEDDNEDSENASEDDRNAPTPARSFLSRFPHQHVLEMDCVREFLTELASELAETARNIVDDQVKLVNITIPRTFGITLPTPVSTNTAPESQPTCACGPPADRAPDTPAPSLSACSVCSEHLPENLLLLGPITLVTLRQIPEQALPRIIASLAPLGRRDLFWDEVMRFWAGVKGMYEGEKKVRELPRECVRVEDVMRVRCYERAVLDVGQIF